MASAVSNAAAAISSAQNPKRSSSFISPVLCRTLIPQLNPNQLPNSNLSLTVSHLKHHRIICRSSAASAVADSAATVTRFHGPCFVLDDNIDTDQIIPAEYLTLLPTKPDEYEKLGSLALCGLPSRYSRFIADGRTKTEFPIIVAGSNFGCGSSREHAPVCLGASGVKAVVAESYARIFFRNCVATGEVFPVESEKRICDECKTGDLVTVDLERSLLVNHSTGKEYVLRPIGDAGPVIQAGGIFAYARKAGMIAPA